MANVSSSSPQSANDRESNIHRIPYPKRVFFIIGNEFCERFNYYGMRAILVLYLEKKLSYTENGATAMFHGWKMTTFFMCLFGGIISDVWLEKFKTILILSVIYLIGSVTVAVSAIPGFSVQIQEIYLIGGLVLISIGSGGIKPNVITFGGDQFKLPEQIKQLATYFSIFYFSISLGSLLSTAVTPIFREEIHCFGYDDCFPLAFGVPSILMLVATVLFVAGKPSYTCLKISSENMIVQVTKCITNAVSMRIREGKINPRPHFLDYSIDEFGEELVNDIKVVLRLAVLHLPLPMFWTLFDQQGSRWTFQAKRMNGDIGFYTIKPDQMQVINPLLILILIPLFEVLLYPLLHKIGIRRPLQKITMGGMLAAIAFLISAILEQKIENSPAKSMHMLWQIPQCIVMTLAEIMFSVTNISFSYEEAPERMKSVVQAIRLMTIAFGNFILIIVAAGNIFESRSNEFLLFSGLMFVDMLIFMGLAFKYKSNKTDVISKEEENLYQSIAVAHIE